MALHAILSCSISDPPQPFWSTSCWQRSVPNTIFTKSFPAFHEESNPSAIVPLRGIKWSPVLRVHLMLAVLRASAGHFADEASQQILGEVHGVRLHSHDHATCPSLLSLRSKEKHTNTTTSGGKTVTRFPRVFYFVTSGK